jgi:PHD/YefM family antitoxin component YafN of YafNO toxin-antitoxin module
MKRVNALELRKSLGKVVEELQATGEPILLERGRRPVGVIISLQDYEQRFVAKDAAEARDRAVARLQEMARASADGRPVAEVVRALRYGES